MGQARQKRLDYGQLRQTLWTAVARVSTCPIDEMLVAARNLLEQAPTIQPPPSAGQIAALEADIAMMEAAQIFTVAVMVIGNKLQSNIAGPTSKVDYVNGGPLEVAAKGRGEGDEP